VAAAAGAEDLRADHAERGVVAQLDRVGDRGLVKLGQPEPESYLDWEENRALPQPPQRNIPSSLEKV
jgi:hypothetical protein